MFELVGYLMDDVCMNDFIGELRVRKKELQNVEMARNYYDLLTIAHSCFMNSTYGSNFQNEIALYSKVTEYYTSINDVTKFEYFKNNLRLIIEGDKFHKFIMCFV